MTPFVVLLLSLVSFLSYGRALQVTPGSTCAALCLDNPESDPLSPSSSNTTLRDITCTDSSYDNSPTGIKFKNCLDCLQTSNATSDAESDVSWFLYNIRYSVDVCLFSFPDAPSEAISSPCDINWACQPLKKALEAGGLDSTRNQLEYCTADGDFTSGHHIQDCIKCFASSPDQVHMSNFMTALMAGCEQKPAPGDLIGLSGSLFTGSMVNITSPPEEVSSENKDSGFGITSTGAIVGIALGGGLLLLGGVALFWIYHRRQKRAFGRISSPDNDPRTGNRSITPAFGGGGGGFSTTEKRAPSQINHYELRTKGGYTNNAEYYNMLEKEMRSQFAINPNHLTSDPRRILPTHPAYLPHSHSRQASQESLQLPRPIKTNKPDSYALQAYLNAAEDAAALALPPPPPGPPPASVVGDPSRLRGLSPNLYPGHSRDSSLNSRGPSPDRRPLLNTTADRTVGAFNPPPPPPPPATRPSKVPSLAFPSVPRIRIPKKYTPPRIAVQSATPVDQAPELGLYSEGQQQTDIPAGPETGKPVVTDEPPIKESLWAKRRQLPPPLIIEQRSVDHQHTRVVADAGTGAANSSSYI